MATFERVSRARPLMIQAECFLCHESLKNVVDGPHSYLPVEPWEKPIISLFPCYEDDGSVRVHLRQVRVAEADDDDEFDVDFLTPYEEVLVWRDPKSQLKYVRIYQQDGLPPVASSDRVIRLAHSCCWQVVNYPKAVPYYELLRLASQTRYLTLWNGGPRYDRFLDLRDNSGPKFDPTTGLGVLVDRLLLLPFEVQVQIMTYLDETLFASLARTRSHIPRLLDQLAGSKRVSVSLEPRIVPIQSNSTPTKLSARRVHLFGLNYLADVALNREDDLESISLGNATVAGLQFVLGRRGIRAIRVLYGDDSYSTWLGEPTLGWIGTIRSDNLNNLHMLVDDLRLIRLSFQANNVTDKATSISQIGTTDLIMWDKDMPSFGYREAHMVKTSKQPSSFIPDYPGWRLMHSVALANSRGITVYMRDDWIVGLVSHGKNESRIGHSRLAVPIHFHLQSGEHLVSASIGVQTTYTTTSSRPIAISVTTNLGRSAYFGTNFGAEMLKWLTVGGSHQSKLAAFVCDPLSIYLTPCGFLDFGAIDSYHTPYDVGDCAAHSGLRIPKVRNPPSLFCTQRSAHLSLAPIDNVLEIYEQVALKDVLGNDRRHIQGLCLVYPHGRMEYLGIWEPTSPSQKIFDLEADGRLRELTFLFPGSYQDLQKLSPPTDVHSILVKTSKYTPVCVKDTWDTTWEKCIDCTKPNQYLAWWFTRTKHYIASRLQRGTRLVEGIQDEEVQLHAVRFSNPQ